MKPCNAVVTAAEKPHLFAWQEGMKEQSPAAHRSCTELFALLSDYIDGKLATPLCTEIERHLDECPPCKGFLASLRNTVTLCAERDAEKPSPEAAKRIRALLLEECRRSIEAKPPRRRPAKPHGCSHCG